MLRILTSCLLILSLASCNDALTDQGRVYEALFKQLVTLDRKYYIREELADPYQHRDLLGDTGQLADYDFPALSPTHSVDEFASVDVQLISQAEFDKMFTDGCKRGWARFHRQYPEAKTLLGMSRVGFSSSRTEAAVYIETGAGCLAGQGNIVYLSKRWFRWKVVNTENLWIS
jgi:hypothetical protein